MERKRQWRWVIGAAAPVLIGINSLAGIASPTTKSALSQTIASKQPGVVFVDGYGESLASLFSGVPMVSTAFDFGAVSTSELCQVGTQGAAAQQSRDLLLVSGEGRLVEDEPDDRDYCSACGMEEYEATCGGDCWITLCRPGGDWGNGCIRTLQSCESGGACWGHSLCFNETCR